LQVYEIDPQGGPTDPDFADPGWARSAATAVAALRALNFSQLKVVSGPWPNPFPPPAFFDNLLDFSAVERPQDYFFTKLMPDSLWPPNLENGVNLANDLNLAPYFDFGINEQYLATNYPKQDQFGNWIDGLNDPAAFFQVPNTNGQSLRGYAAYYRFDFAVALDVTHKWLTEGTDGPEQHQWGNAVHAIREQSFSNVNRTGFLLEADLWVYGVEAFAPYAFKWGWGDINNNGLGWYRGIAPRNFRLRDPTIALPHDQWYEVPLPQPDDGDVGAVADGKLGKIVFAILSETPAQWTARTGVGL
jgi:hypothetical protein